MVPHGGRNFSIKVDADSLQMGLNYAEVMGFDALNEWRGPVFRVPVTAILPDECASNGRVDLGLMHFTDGAEFRHFVTVPEGASHAELKLTAVGDFPPRHFLVRLTEILPKTRYR